MARVREGRPVARFYQVAASSPEVVMVGLLFKLVDQGMRVCVLAADGGQVRHLDDQLWRYPAERFLPHGVWDGVDVERQPVLIAMRPDDRNGATVVIVAGAQVVDESVAFDVVVDFVDVRDPVPARGRYRQYQARGYQMEYWIQSPEGRWNKQG
ncbi:MAG: DNA polymerase III subunit chi [Magnetococcales bacterium]|nr:DNA polymerase III subunit chi [Magnetococcales bacterium]